MFFDLIVKLAALPLDWLLKDPSIDLKTSYRSHFPLCQDSHNKLQCQLASHKATVEHIKLADAYFDTSQFALLQSSQGRSWLRYREIEGISKGTWKLRVCDKMTVEAKISYVDIDDEGKIFNLIAPLVTPATKKSTATDTKTLWDLHLRIYARLLTTRMSYSFPETSPRLFMNIDCTYINAGKFILQGTAIVSGDGLAVQEVRDANVPALPIRSKVLSYIHERKEELYKSLCKWGVVPEEVVFQQWHTAPKPGLPMTDIWGAKSAALVEKLRMEELEAEED